MLHSIWSNKILKNSSAKFIYNCFISLVQMFDCVYKNFSYNFCLDSKCVYTDNFQIVERYASKKCKQDSMPLCYINLISKLGSHW